MTDSVTLPCPICGNPVTVPVIWEKERGDFGVILSEQPVMSSNPTQIDQHGTCFCDFSLPLAQAMADYYNDGLRLYDLLDSVADRPKDDTYDEVEITSSDATERSFLMVRRTDDEPPENDCS